ncbi:MAG TPA: TonB family protein [Candidatus Acidoferrum sp.]|nr:TonB family protein [Candidatus Acidoferrum sp.]
MNPRRAFLVGLTALVMPFAATTPIVAQESSASPMASCAEPNRVAQPIHATEPDYPDAAANLHLKKTSTMVGVKTDATGAVTAVWLLVSSGNDDLDKAALSAARRSTFRPALVNCAPAASAFSMLEEFEPESGTDSGVRTPAAAVAPSPSFSPPPGWTPYNARAGAGWQMFSSWRSGRSVILVEGGAAIETIDQFHQQEERTLMARGASIVTDRAVLICNQTQAGWLFVYTLRSGSVGYADIGAFQPNAMYLVTYGSYDEVHPSQSVMASLTSLCMPQ